MAVTDVTPRRIGPYEIQGLLGEGGIGQVYAARDTVLGRTVAIKTLRPEMSRDRNLIDRFYVEAKSLANFNHLNITTLHALQLEGHEAFMVMELVRGNTLTDLLARVRRFSLRESLAVVAQAVAGLGYAHRMGVIHRDIKPSNLMVTDEGVLKIMDFGVARVRGSQQLTRTGEFYGTVAYASPEQIRGEPVDERADLYSLAVVLYRMLAGVVPFSANGDFALMTAQVQTPPPPLGERVANLSPETETAVMRALAKRPEDRFASVEEFGRAVGTAAIRGEAVDILQQFVAEVFEDPGSDTTRIFDWRSAPEPETTPAAQPVKRQPIVAQESAQSAPIAPQQHTEPKSISEQQPVERAAIASREPAKDEPIASQQLVESEQPRDEGSSDIALPVPSLRHMAVKPAPLAAAMVAIAILAVGVAYTLWPAPAPSGARTEASSPVVSPTLVQSSDERPAEPITAAALDTNSRTADPTQPALSTSRAIAPPPVPAESPDKEPQASARPSAPGAEQSTSASSAESETSAAPRDQKTAMPDPGPVAPAPRIALVDPPKPPPPVKPEPFVAPAPPVAESQAEGEPRWSSQEKREVQRALRALGHLQSEPDGDFGPRTRAAIKQFQSFAAEPESGTLSSEQRTSLLGMAQRLTSLLEQPATSPLGVSAVTLSGGPQRYALAWRIANGKDKVHDPAEADYWLRLAAADGEVNALVDLGKRVVNSQRSTQGNPEAARLLWWVAAAHNEPIAMFNLGSMYEHGVGVTADVISARKWYQRSAALSHALASDALRRLGP